MPKHKKSKPAQKKLSAAKRKQIADNVMAQVDTALGTGGTKKGKKMPFPGADQLAGAVYDLKRVVNACVQKTYDQVLSQTIIKLQHARKKTIV